MTSPASRTAVASPTTSSTSPSRRSRAPRRSGQLVAGLRDHRLGRSQRPGVRHDVPVRRAAARRRRQHGRRAHAPCTRVRLGQPGARPRDPHRPPVARSATPAPSPPPVRTIELQVTGVAGIDVPSDATTVFLNVTAVNTAADGFVTVYPCGSPRPTASSFNPLAGTITHNLVAARGRRRRQGVHLHQLVDRPDRRPRPAIHPSTAAYVPTQPERLLETRTD